MPKKNYFDFSLFDEVGDAMDLFANTVRNAFEYDSIGDKTIFEAIVITPPAPLAVQELNAFLSIDPGEDSLNNPLPKFAFKARIIGANSPHLFLPNPCNPRQVVELQRQQNIQDVIDMHTTVIAFDAVNKPDLGDIVKIRINPGTFSVNVQNAEFVGIVSNDNSAIQTILKSNGQVNSCTKFQLQNAFGEYKGEVLGNSLTDRGVSYTKHFDPGAPRLGFPVAGGNWGSAFGKRKSPLPPYKIGWHNGTDVGAARGTPVLAAADGVIVGIRDNVMGEGSQAPGYTSGGNTMTLKHKGQNGKTYYTLYMHLLEKDRTDGLPPTGGILLPIGQAVAKGQAIGLVGNTGGSTCPHLHFELRGPGGADGVGLNPVFHDERYFDVSINNLREEKAGNLPQAPVESPEQGPLEEGTPEP